MKDNGRTEELTFRGGLVPEVARNDDELGDKVFSEVDEDDNTVDEFVGVTAVITGLAEVCPEATEAGGVVATIDFLNVPETSTPGISRRWASRSKSDDKIENWTGVMAMRRVAVFERGEEDERRGRGRVWDADADADDEDT